MGTILRWLLPIMLLLGAAADAAAQGSERAVVKQVVISAPIGKVWRSWTTREGIESFFAPEAVIDARPGGAFHIHVDPYARPGLKGADEMRYLALQEPKMLSFDWNAPPSMPDVRRQRTFVILRFEAVDNRNTRLTLHHTGWGDGGEWDQAFRYFDNAWDRVLENLERSHTEGPLDWTEWRKTLRQAHAQAAQDAKPKQ